MGEGHADHRCGYCGSEMNGAGDLTHDQEYIGVPPLIHANVVTMIMTEDTLALEFREFHADHMANASEKPGLTGVGVSLDDLKGIPPKAKVVLTFAAAYSIWAYLQETMPIILKSRATVRPGQEAPK